MWQLDHLENTNLTIHQSDKPLSGTELSELGRGGQSRGEFKITRFVITLTQPVTLFSHGMPIADVLISLTSFKMETDVIASLKADSRCGAKALRSCCARWHWNINKDQYLHHSAPIWGKHVFSHHSRNLLFTAPLWICWNVTPSAYTRLLWAEMHRDEGREWLKAQSGEKKNKPEQTLKQ